MFACAAVALGCEPPFQHRVADARIAPQLIVALPITTLPYPLDGFDDRVEKQQRVDVMEGFMTPVLARFVTGCGGRLLDQTQFEACGPRCAQFSRWAALAGMEIAAQKLGRAQVRRRSVAEWSYPADVTPLARTLGASQALVVAFKDAREAGAGSPWNELGVACLIDLGLDGRVLWCEARVDAGQDLGHLAGATRTIDQLLRPMFSSASPACAPPPAM